MLRDFFGRFLPANASTLVSVKATASDYLVSFDLGALNPLIKAAGAGVTYEPAALVYKATEQDDGKWRVVLDSLPKIASSAGDMRTSVEFTNFRQTLLIDPAIAWYLSGSANSDKGVVETHAPKLDQTIDFGPFHADAATVVNPDGSVSTTVKEDFSDIGVKTSVVGKNDAPASISGRLKKALLNVAIDGLKTRTAFDLLALIAAHPSRADLAPHEAELKGLLKELAAPGLKFVEGGEAHEALIQSKIGAVALASLKGQFGMANAGPHSSVSLILSAGGLSLPVGLAPPGAADLTPSEIDLAATFKGIDIAAAANEAIADMRLQGDDPPISEADSAKVMAALLSAGPMRLDIALSHIHAPAIDASFEGEIRYAPGKPSGVLTIHMRGFDKTMAAVKALGPAVAVKALPGFAMAKGLAKTDSDGSLSWVVEIGQDRSITVNGLPLGKAPD